MTSVYWKTIVCLAASFKTGGICLAGRVWIEGKAGDWIRPVSHRSTRELSPGEYLCADRSPASVLDIVDVPLLHHVPEDHQTENHLVANRSWVRKGRFPIQDLGLLCDDPPCLWTNRGSKTSGTNDWIYPGDAEQFSYSLLLLKPRALAVLIFSRALGGNAKTTYRGRFEFKGVSYNLSITDPSFIRAFSGKPQGEYSMENVFLCVSLTEPFRRDNRCYKLIAAVFGS